jgi:uncharacterized protein (TIGR02301 family)
MLKRALTIALVALSVTAAPVRAIEGGPAPFDSDLMRLAEILGALQYLRGLCGANEGNKWRDQMTALLDAEAQSGDRRNRLVANFNIAASSGPIGPAPPPRQSRCAATSMKAPRSRARSPRATPTRLGRSRR